LCVLGLGISIGCFSKCRFFTPFLI
jgi:hypothetical protein